MTTLIDCQNITVSFHDKQILNDINLQIEKHDYVCIVGPNGAGKSTLLKTLMGIAPISSGQLLLNQTPYQQLTQKQLARQVAYVPQSHQKLLTFEVEAFIKMSRYPFHSAVSEWQPEDQSAVEYALEITKTDAFRHRQMTDLSGGERQRVMIAAALAQQTPILLLDEPMSFLDPHHQVEVQQILHTLNKDCELTVIEVSHDINHASQYSEKIIALKQGKLFWQGDSADFFNTERLGDLYEHDFVFVSHPETGKPVALPSHAVGAQS